MSNSTLVNHLKTVLSKEYFLEAHPGVENANNEIVENSFEEFLNAADEAGVDLSNLTPNQIVDVKYVTYLASTIFSSCTQLVNEKAAFDSCVKTFKLAMSKHLSIKPVIVSLLSQSLESYEDGSIWKHLSENGFPKEVLITYDPRDGQFFNRKALMQEFILSIKSL